MLSCSCAFRQQRQSPFEHGRRQLLAEIAPVAEELAVKIVRELLHGRAIEIVGVSLMASISLC